MKNKLNLFPVLFFSSLLILNSCKKEEKVIFEKHTATFEVNCAVPYSISYAYLVSGKGGDLESEKGIGAKTKTIEINIEKGKELQLFVLSDNGTNCYIEAAIKVDGVEKVRHNKICSVGQNFAIYKFE